MTELQNVNSVPAVPIDELVKCCAAAFLAGEKVVSYRCLDCGSLRQFNILRSKEPLRRIVVKCGCGGTHTVNLFGDR